MGNGTSLLLDWIREGDQRNRAIMNSLAATAEERRNQRRNQLKARIARLVSILPSTADVHVCTVCLGSRRLVFLRR